MKNLLHLPGILLGVLAFAPVASAQVATSSYVAETAAKPGCRATVLHVVRDGQKLSGVVFFKDGSGTSSVEGTVSTNNKSFDWHMASVTGHGPVGEVTGEVTQDGILTAHLVGTDCRLDVLLPKFSDEKNG